MAHSFLIAKPLTPAPVSTSLKTLSVLLDLTERRIQQLAREGIIVRDKRGRYDFIPSIQSYVRYLRAQVQNKTAVMTEEALAKAIAGCELAIPNEESRNDHTRLL